MTADTSSLTVEPLVSFFKTQDELKGFRFGDQSVIISQLADDACLFLRNVEELKLSLDYTNVLQILQIKVNFKAV